MPTEDLKSLVTGSDTYGAVPPAPPLPKPQPKPRTRKPTTTLKEPAPAKKSTNKRGKTPAPAKKTVKAKSKPAPEPSPWVKVVTATNGMLVSVYIDAADWNICFRTERGDTMGLALDETMPSKAMAAIGPKEVQVVLDWHALANKVAGE